MMKLTEFWQIRESAVWPFPGVLGLPGLFFNPIALTATQTP